MAKTDTNRDDYITAIYYFMELYGFATNKQISERMGIKAASVTEMIKKLIESGDVYVDHKMICLGEKGMERARYILTKHRLWEIFLVKYLGYTWEDVHEDAKALEHATSDKLKNKLNSFLKHPQHCPHGNEVFENHQGEDTIKPLSALMPGESGRIHKVFDDKRLIEYMEKKNLQLNDLLKVKEIDGFDHSVFVEKEGECIYISEMAAKKLMIMM